MPDARSTLSSDGTRATPSDSLLAPADQADTVARLRSVVAAQARIIRAQAASLAHSRKIFERASAAARIGVWECELAGEKLTWTDGVYDIFEFPRGSAIDRQTTLGCYTPESARELDARRRAAIENQTGFSLDAEITTVLGKRRWIRITATVECEDGVASRVFGMKQDITEEKLLADRTRYLAEFDAMTGLANRQRFQASLDALSHEGRPVGALLLIDLDGFKKVNDTFGHAIGDACLKEVAERLRRACRDGEPAFRIGGDEFAVFAGRDAAEDLASRIVVSLGRPIDVGGKSMRIGASVGIADRDGCAGPELFTHADTALYAAKDAGRNTLRRFASAMTRPSTV